MWRILRDKSGEVSLLVVLGLIVFMGASAYLTTTLNQDAQTVQSRAAGRCGENCDNPGLWINQCMEHDSENDCRGWFDHECTGCDSGGGNDPTATPKPVGGTLPTPTQAGGGGGGAGSCSDKSGWIANCKTYPQNQGKNCEDMYKGTCEGGGGGGSNPTPTPTPYDPGQSSGDQDIQTFCGVNRSHPSCCKINEWLNKNQSGNFPDCSGGTGGHGDNMQPTPTPKPGSIFPTVTPTPVPGSNCVSPEVWCPTQNKCAARMACPTPTPVPSTCSISGFKICPTQNNSCIPDYACPTPTQVLTKKKLGEKCGGNSDCESDWCGNSKTCINGDTDLSERYCNINGENPEYCRGTCNPKGSCAKPTSTPSGPEDCAKQGRIWCAALGRCTHDGECRPPTATPAGKPKPTVYPVDKPVPTIGLAAPPIGSSTIVTMPSTTTISSCVCTLRDIGGKPYNLSPECNNTCFAL